MSSQNRYLIEVQKPGTDWAIAGTKHGKTMSDVLQALEPQLGPADSVRVSLLSVSLVVARDLSSPMGFKAVDVAGTPGQLRSLYSTD